jgi:hypothetical protein
MDNKRTYILTFCYENSLIKYSVTFNTDVIDEDIFMYYREPGSRERIRNLLPTHIKSLGEIVNVKHINGSINL